jgi:hypothetical protein
VQSRHGYTRNYAFRSDVPPLALSWGMYFFIFFAKLTSLQSNSQGHMLRCLEKDIVFAAVV